MACLDWQEGTLSVLTLSVQDSTPYHKSSRITRPKLHLGSKYLISSKVKFNDKTESFYTHPHEHFFRYGIM